MSKTPLEAFDEEIEDDTELRSHAANRLRSLIERIERLDEEITSLRADKTDIFAEAKAAGYDTAVMRLIIKRRKLDPASREELDTMLDLYEEGLGM